MRRLFTVLLGSLLLWLAGGCSVYVDNYRFAPRPAVLAIPAQQPNEPPAIVTFASVIGVRRADRDAQLPPCVEVSLRLENDGPQTAALDPRTLELTDAALSGFPPPILRPPGPVTLRPTESATVQAFFPFPPGRSYDNTDLSSLRLRWQLQLDGRTVTESAQFRRSYHVYYYDPYPYWYWGYGPYPYGLYGGWYGGWHGGWYGGAVIRHR